VDSMGINQGKSLITVMNIFRERVWKQLGLNYIKINVDIDTIVKTIYGNQQGGRKGHNNKHRGKKATVRFSVLSNRPVNTYWASYE
jgi:hypothetical protein